MKLAGLLTAILFLSLIATPILALTGCAAPAAATPTTPPKAASPTPAAAAPIASVVVAATKGPDTVAKPTAATAAIRRGGEIRWARNEAYRSLDPQLTQTSTKLLYDALTNLEWNDAKQLWEVTPDLATSWEVPKPDTIIFHLQKGVKFHDGTDFDAEAAKWNIDRMRTHQKSFAKDYLNLVSSVDVIDPSTIKLNLRSNSALPQLVGVSGAADPIAFLSKTAVETMGDDLFGQKGGVGTGPMQLVDWQADTALKLKRFPGYWRKGADGQPLPYLDAATVRVINDNSVRLLEIRAGNLDMDIEVDPKDVASIKANPDLRYWQSPSTGSIKFTFAFNPNKEPFKSNMKLRQALQYATDRESMSKVMGFGVTTVHPYPFWVPGYPGWDANNPHYTYDLPKAKQLLVDAGFPKGLEFGLTFPTRTETKRVAEVAEEMWDKAGFQVVLDGVERTAAINKLAAGNFDSYHWSGTVGPDPDQNTRNLATGAAGNWVGFSSKQMDSCLEEGRTTPDAKARHEVYVKCQKIMYEEALHGSAYLQATSAVYHKRLQGMKFQYRIDDAREAWISQ